MAITNFISTIWSENLYKQLDKKYVGVMNCSRDYEGDIKNQGSVVKICGIDCVNISDYTKNSDIGGPEMLSDVARTLRIDQAKYFNFQIDDVDKALANEADAYVYSLYSEAYNNITDDNVTAEKLIDHIISLKTIMMQKGVLDPNDIVLEVTPEIAAMILKAKIDIGSDNMEALESGLLGKIAGCKVYVSNNVVVDENNYHQCLFRTKRAVTFAEQISEVEAYRPEKRFADAVKGLHLYGAKIVYPEEFMVLSVRFDS